LKRCCPVCAHQCHEVLFRPKSSPGPVSRCLNCGMVYVATIEDGHALIYDGPVLYGDMDSEVLESSDLSAVQDTWELSNIIDKEAEWPALRQNAIDAIEHIALYANNLPADPRVLDLGSGLGFFLAIAKEHGWDAYGLEPLPASSVYARAKFGLHIVTDTLHEDTFPPKSFDVITSFQVFEHLLDPRATTRYLHKMLRRNGTVLIEVPDFDTWTMNIMSSHHRHFVQDHLNFFSSQTLGRLLVDSGFRILAHYHPARRMSVRHLVTNWIRPIIPAPIGAALQATLARAGLWERAVALNIGDITAVLARKL